MSQASRCTQPPETADVPVRVGAPACGFGVYVHGQDSAYPTDAPASSGAGSSRGAACGGT